MYPKVKVRAAELNNEHDQRPGSQLEEFDSLSIRDFTPAEKGSKPASSLSSVAKVPRSYVPRSITPHRSLPKVAPLTAAKKSEQEAEDNGKPHIRASSVPRPRAVVSSPDNDQLLGYKNKMRLERPSTLKNQNLAQSRRSEGSCGPTTNARKPLRREVESKDAANKTSDAKGNEGSALYVRVPKANIVKAKPCFTIN